ncbi:Isotrichodermin C-15 hydroxylase [Daldinia childiae]|uniref:Isotrichodermin C-15 hydroxylase n=1 Tax=Daldinia childiae TaxID=326645 RepID=UPI0014484870|nr:Isotrichodermin C-15 hydroxylase [Daldinia childiae]KAF3058220.1 Isotrichodermin C-15 hydroxylase [Daldinia childiae]
MLGTEETAISYTLGYPIYRAICNLFFHPLSKIKGPPLWSASRLPFIYSLLRGTLIHDVENLHRKYGPVVRIAPDEVTFAQAEAYQDIFQSRPDNKPFLKDHIWWETQPGLPDTILSAINPEKHARIRRLLAPGFTPRALRDQEPILHQYVNLLVERLHERARETKEARIDLVPWLNFTTFDIIGDLGFGDSFNCLQHSRYHPWIALLFSTVKAATWVASARYYPLVESILLKCIPPSLMKTQTDHYQRIADKVDRRLNFEVERPDILSYVIKKREEEAIPIGEINSTFMILTTAGSETTATLLTGIMNYLVNYPDKLGILVDEIRHNFHRHGDITLEALRGLPYLNAVINEGFRLCPPVPWILPRRVPQGGGKVCGIWLPGGTAVSVQAYTTNRDPNYFHSASAFIPERWLPEVHSDPTSPFSKDCREAVQPFSLGPRSCLGQNLAMAELRLIISKLLWTFDFEAIEEERLDWENLRVFLLIEKKPIQVKIRLRSGVS